MDNRFTWNDRLHLRADFTAAIQRGRRYSASGLIVWVYRHPESPRNPRLGLAIPRAYGNAVERNRLKRLLREIFRLNKAQLPKGVDLVFSARSLPPKLQYRMLEPIVKLLWNKADLITRPA